MNSDDSDLALMRQEDGTPTPEHDRVILEAIDQASARIAGRKKRRSGFLWIAVPLAMAASIVLVPFWLGDRDDLMREPAGEISVFPANTAVLAEPPRELRWPAQTDATGYHVVLRQSNGATLIEMAVHQPHSSIALANEDLQQMTPGNTYFWSVIVEDSVQRELGPYWFSLLAPSDGKSQ